jgi:hypothetical protein
MRRKPENRQTTLCKYEDMTHAGESGCTVDRLKRAVIPDIIRCLNQRFVSFDQNIFGTMQWIDQSNWTDDDSGDLESIQVYNILPSCQSRCSPATAKTDIN